MKSRAYLCLPLLALFAMSGTSAKENYDAEKAINAETRKSSPKWLRMCAEGNGKDGGGTQDMKVRRTCDGRHQLTEMETLSSQNDSVQSMKQDTKIKLFNAQEVVNSILTRRDRDRVICKNEAPIGSHIPVTTCHTYGQEVEAHEQTRNQLEEWKRGACRGKCGSP